LADKPFPHRTHVVAMPRQCGDEPDGGKTIFGHAAAESIVLKAFGLRGVAVEIQDGRRLLYPPGPDHIEIDGIACSPPYLYQLARKLGRFVLLPKKWVRGMKIAAGDGERAPILMTGSGNCGSGLRRRSDRSLILLDV